MSVTYIRGTEVNRPEPDAVTSSVLEHATVETTRNFGIRNNAGLWPSYNCIDTLVPTAICPNPVQQVKTFANASWVPALEFAVYGAVKCHSVGLDQADQDAEIKRVFARNEGKGVEMALLHNRFVATESDAKVKWDAPVDLTGANNVSLVVALALLEGYAASVYAGLPTIHMPRMAATVLEASGLIVWIGDKAFTKNGSKVAIGGGYDNPEVPTTGTVDLYATGEVYVEQSETIDVRAHVLPGDGSIARGHQDNEVLSLVERMYRVGVDCFVAKATGTVWS